MNNCKKTELSAWTAGINPGSLIMIMDNACTLTYEEMDLYIDKSWNVQIKRGPFSDKFLLGFVLNGHKHSEYLGIILNDPGKMISQETIASCIEVIENNFVILEN